MLSDEEKEALEILNNTEWDGFMITIKNLIEKQSKETEELKEQCKEVVCVPEGTCFMLEPKEINKKWEDKIKAKIEELEKQDRENRMSHNYLVIPVLQSLLEKE